MAAGIQLTTKQSNKQQQSTEPILISGSFSGRSRDAENPSVVICPECSFANDYSVVICRVCGRPLGRKFDELKIDWTLFPWKAGAAIVRIMMFGAKKYARDNWKHVKPGTRYLAAAIRHISDWLDGEINDKESGYSHLWHAGCCIMFAIWLEIEGKIKAGNLNETN